MTPENPDISTAAVRDLQSGAGDFYSLGPEQVLDAVEIDAGLRTTGLCYPLNSLENRVYEIELDGGDRVVGKFYRPGRWSKQTIAEEVRVLYGLRDNEIPVCAPLSLTNGETIAQTKEGILFVLYPKTGGRSPDEIQANEYEQLGRLLGRIHNVMTKIQPAHRPSITPATYGIECMELICSMADLQPGLESRYRDAVQGIVEVGERRFEGVDLIPVHGDCHRSNLLRDGSLSVGGEGFFFLDFDDMGLGPAVQDFWLLLPARRAECAVEIEAMTRGYEQFRELDRASLQLIEVLRPLRYVRYAAWLTSRWQDPAFKRAFPNFGTERYWEEQIADLYEQLQVLNEEDAGYTGMQY